MKRYALAALAAWGAHCAAAFDLSGLADIRFAEQYAFSTNRAAVIETLRPGTEAWHVYSILNAQTEGRLDEAKKMWEKESTGTTRRPLAYRQDFLDWDRGKCPLYTIADHLGFLKIWDGLPEREVEIKPNDYPSELKPEEISYKAFSGKFNPDVAKLEPGFRFLGLKDEKRSWHSLVYDSLPDTPGLFDLIVEIIKERNFEAYGALKNLTLAQLAALAQATKGTKHDVSGSAAFANVVLAKLAAGADDDPNDFKTREELLKRRLEFTKTLAPSLKKMHVAAERELLQFYRDADDLSHKELFVAYLNDIRPGRGMAIVNDGDRLEGALADLEKHGRKVANGDSLVREYLAALAPDDMKTFGDIVEKKYLEKIVAEAGLLAGKPAKDVNADIFSASEFKKMQERVELNWARSNKKVFAAKDDVSLAIDVKNVQKMRVAIYELDAAAACREANGEVAGDIDLDCAVPTVERVLDFSGRPSILRHREQLDFPELKPQGLYVVECSGGGVSSRAVVRKGRLRATQRRDAAGHVFAALDEDGRIVKGAKVWLDGTVFEADEGGEVSVPFAADADHAGKKTAIVGAGRLASAVAFEHEAERYSLDMQVVLPQEALVAGSEATALLRPTLRTSGVVSTLKLLEHPVLTVTFTDIRDATSVKTYRNFALFDDAESVCRFTVPRSLQKVAFRLEGSVKRVTGGEDERLSCEWSTGANAIAKSRQVEQLFLRRTSKGYVLECRGRTGERIASRAVALTFKHRAFRRPHEIKKTLQGDENGEIALGALTDIAEVLTDAFGGWKWRLDDGVRLSSQLDRGIASAEGETIAIPARGLFAGAWPGADIMANRVSLLAVNKAGEVTEDCVRACSYSNGVLRIAGLLAGDYMLRFRTENSSAVKISIAKAAKTVGDGGVIASAARSLSDTGDPDGLRIESAAVATNGVLRVRLAKAGEGARVHVFAARTTPAWWERTPAETLAGAPMRPRLREGTWGGVRTDYISGRNLGDKLRYILDRRQEPGRIGNMLQRPSLLLNPWTTSETDTKEMKLSEGETWETDSSAGVATSVPFDAEPRALSAYGGRVKTDNKVCFDFMPAPEAVFANLRLGKDGVVEVDLRARAAGMQDSSVGATDGSSIDEVRLAGAPAPFKPRDLRVNKDFDAVKRSARAKSVSTLGELYAILKSIAAADKTFAEFGFIADWASKSQVEKRELYGRYASHELDFFLHEKDRAFFDAVVAPSLRNKRLKEFMDKWLLGEDLSEYAKPGRIQDLNALEQCLLARRIQSIAPVVARNFADVCEHDERTDPPDVDALLSSVLGDEDYGKTQVVMSCANIEPEEKTFANVSDLMQAETARAAKPGMAMAQIPAAPVPAAQAAWSSQRAFAPQPLGKMKAARAPAGVRERATRNAELTRRASRQFYRPPERTKEWVESHWYRRRHSEDTKALAAVNRFWRDYAAATANGGAMAFRSASILFTAGEDNFSQMIAALAVSGLGFEAKDGESVVFSHAELARTQRAKPDAKRGAVRLERHFFDASEANEDGAQKEVVDEFVRGRVYYTETIAINPSAKARRVRVVSQVPSGAYPVNGCEASNGTTLALGPYETHVPSRMYFYFPFAEDGIGDAPGAVALENGERVGVGEPFKCNVVAQASTRDTTSWRYVSQNATKDEVLAYLKTKNLEGVDLEMMGWRFVDGEFAKNALDVLDLRGVYCQDLWLAGLKWKDTFDAARVREALSRRENLKKLAQMMGPAFKCSLFEIEPEEADVFEHREYWPIINARVHAKGGAATIANSGLAKEYRAFLDTLAAKRELSTRDRLLAAVYMIAQDRIAEAEEQLAHVDASDVDTAMQLGYMKAYLAFSHGDAARGREIAVKWRESAVGVWRRRFNEVVAQADEVLGGGVAAAKGAAEAEAPSLAVKADMKDGVVEGVIITARSLAKCTVKVYPVDVEIAFSKNPFGGTAAGYGGVMGLRPAWTQDVKLEEGRETRVALPKELRRTNLVLAATGADGRAEERLELTPGTLEVQVAREARQLRVRDGRGKPVAGAYVKVYVRDAAGRETKFHKDGYTDLRGVFDYEAVSTDSDFRPAEFAVFVQSADGVRTLRISK